MNVLLQSILLVKYWERQLVWGGSRSKQDIKENRYDGKNSHSHLAMKTEEKMNYNHFRPTRMFITTATTTIKGNKCWWGCGETGTLTHRSWEGKWCRCCGNTGSSPKRWTECCMAWQVRSQVHTWERWKHMFVQELVHKCSQQHIYQSPKVEPTRMPISWLMNKQNILLPHSGIHLATKRNEK